jgi:hypothetical protein
MEKKESRRTVFAAAKDHILRPVHERDVPVLANDREITGVEPPVFIERIVIATVAVPVSMERRRAANPDFADFFPGVYHRESRLRVQNFDVHKRERAAARAYRLQLRLHVVVVSETVGQDRHGYFPATLGHPVRDEKLAAENCNRPRHRRRRERTPAARHHA